MQCVSYSNTGHAKIAAWYEKDGKGNKKEVAFITKARCQKNFEKSAKIVKQGRV
jgi:hypothetical protein